MKLHAGLALCLGVLCLAACTAEQRGADVATAASGGTAARPSATASLSEQQMRLDWARCLREHGLAVADPVDGDKVVLPDGPGKADPGFEAYQKKFEAAQDACRHLAPPGAAPGSPLTAEQAERLLQLAKCMRAKGFDWPDPVAGQLAPPPPARYRRDASAQAALTECVKTGQASRMASISPVPD
jgi:hypothetical protein